jgi:UDP-glucuronate 4-epimerase
MKILITGCAGFIGSHLTERFLATTAHEIMGVDWMTANYDAQHKRRNLSVLGAYDKFVFREENMRESTCIAEWKPDIVIHLASSAGVRASLDDPTFYVKNNIEAFVHVLDEARKVGTKRVLYASSSSVYGKNTNLPYTESDSLTCCASPYASSKLAMEHFADTFSHLYDIECIGFRFFTVYGPRGRPDMAPYKFLHAIRTGDTICKFGDGTSSRDYTYVDDIVDGIIRACDMRQKMKCASTIYNLGNTHAVDLNTFIETCEAVVGKKAIVRQMSIQKGDVMHTHANIEKARSELDYTPTVSVTEGLQKMYEWMVDTVPIA